MKDIEKIFPEGFPTNFREKLLTLGAKEQSMVVYRICKYGKLDEMAFLSTFEETVRKLRKGKLIENDVGSYSTSCHQDIKDSQRLLKFTLRRPFPKAFIAKGVIKEEKGLVQLTSERNSNCSDSHVDWWIYANAQPHLDFKVVDDDE